MSELTIQQAFNLALEHHQAGRLQQAQQIYRQILVQQPAHVGAMHHLGVLAHQQGQNEAAANLIRKALALSPDLPDAHNNLGTVLQCQGQIDEAIASYRHALTLKSDFPNALYNLAGALQRKGQMGEAISAYRQTIALLPTYVEAHNNLGIALMDSGQADEAIAAFRQTIALSPKYAPPYSNLGNLLRSKRRFDEAIIAYRQAIVLDPNLPEAHCNLGNSLKEKGLLDEAVAAYRRAIALRHNFAEAHTNLGNTLHVQQKLDQAIAAHRQAIQINPEFAPAHVGLANALREKGQLEDAQRSLREALRLDPESKQIAFEVAALSGDNSVPKAPPTVVRKLFDEYAGHFDAHLVSALQYRGPEHLRSAIGSITARTDLGVLDLGCGTGLCGVELRPMARRLVGVDLSPGMLERCAERKIYDELIEGDITDVLLKSPAQWDLIVAGDVMVYVGDLTAVLSAASAALRPDGWLAFTVERYEGTGFFLNTSFRYSHSLEYIRELAACAGLDEVLTRELTIRLQSNQPVAGWVVVLRKRNAASPDCNV